MSAAMTESQFWRRAADFFNQYHDRYRKSLLTDEEQREDISSYLSDMDSLSSAWHSRDQAEREGKT